MARGLPVTIGIDLSTTAVKAAVVAADGRTLAAAAVPYPTRYLPGGQVDQDARDWWRASVEAVRLAVSRSRAGHRVAAICAASQGISIVPVDAAGSPLAPALNWLDTRAVREADELIAAFPGDRLPRITGRLANSSFSLPKIMWWQRHDPELVAATAQWLTPAPYLVREMTGRAVSDHTLAVGTLLYDIHRRDWSEPMLGYAGLAREQLPELMWAGGVAGVLTERAALAMGVSAGIPVVVGGQDQKCAAYHAGIRPGLATISLGTASAVSALVTTLPDDDRFPVPLSPFLDPSHWVLEAVVPVSGACLEWLGRVLGGDGPPVSAARLIRLAAGSPPGANGVTFAPHLAGTGTPDWDTSVAGEFRGLRLGTSAADLSRAVLEGVATELARCLDILRDLGARVDEVRLFGGGTRSALWPDVIAHALGVPVETLDRGETVALGAAKLARERVESPAR